MFRIFVMEETIVKMDGMRAPTSALVSLDHYGIRISAIFDNDPEHSKTTSIENRCCTTRNTMLYYLPHMLNYPLSI